MLLLTCPHMSAEDSTRVHTQSIMPMRATRQTLPADSITLPGDSITLPGDSAFMAETPIEEEKESFVPDSNKALWFAALCPGLGQIYNRRYWKLPIVASGIVGVSYAISWNGKYYEAYTYAYRDLIDGDPNTNYFEELIPPGAHYSESQMQTLFKNRQQTFRRQRDLSIIVGVGLYLICLLDAYVDAELFTFDISDNLSFEWGSKSQDKALPWREPNWMLDEPQSLNLSFSLNF